MASEAVNANQFKRQELPLAPYAETLRFIQPGDVPVAINKLRANPAVFIGQLHEWEDSSLLYPPSHETAEEAQWADARFREYQQLDMLLISGLPRVSSNNKNISRFSDPTLLTREELEQLDRCGYGYFREMMEKSDYETQKKIMNFLGYDLWLSSLDVHNSTPRGEAISPSHLAAQASFTHKKELILPLLQLGARESAKQQDKAFLRNIFFAYKNIGANEQAKQILFDDALTAEERLACAVGYMNAYGFILGVSVLAHAIGDEERYSPKVREELKTVFNHIQGEETEQILAELSEVYNAINFNEYVLNNQELTEKECDLLENEVEERKDARLLDIGAGPGRHCIELKRRGYTDVTAVDYEEKHIRQIQEKAPQIKTIKGSWHELKAILPVGYEADEAYCLGRSSLHNTDPLSMFLFYDEARSVVKAGGKLTVDVPAIDWGQYQTNITRLNTNLASLGIAATHSRYIFDGPTEEHKFNRLIPRPEQIKMIEKVLGLTMRSSETRDIGDMRNIYYVFEKDSDFEPRSISREELTDAVYALGLYEPGADFNRYIEAWDMTLGQALVYGLGNPLDEKAQTAEMIRERNRRQKLQVPNQQTYGPQVHATEVNGQIYLVAIRRSEYEKKLTSKAA